MGYNLDYTKTADLLAVYKQERPVTTFLKDRYFPDGRAAGNTRFPRLLPQTLGNFPGCL